MQFGVTDVGGGHILLTGNTNALGVVVPVTGSALIDTPPNVRINYTWSSPFLSAPGSAAKQMFESGHMVLSGDTLNGTLDMMDSTFDPAKGTTTSTHLTGTVTLIKCN